MSGYIVDDFIPVGRPCFDEAEYNAIENCMRSNWIGTGRLSEEFSKSIANFKEVAESVVLNSCTAGLHLSILELGLEKGDEVITTPLTFCATVNSIIHSGATPVLADIDPVTLNIDPNAIEASITERTKAIIPVHFAGLSCNMTEIMRIARKYSLKVIEDCAHAFESFHAGQPIGTFGNFGVFSFYSTKNIVTGEGGAVIAKCLDELKRIKVKSLHGMDKDAWGRFSKTGKSDYDVVTPGFKYNMTDLNASIGLVQIEKVSRFRERRKQLWAAYNSGLDQNIFELPFTPSDLSEHAFHLYVVKIRDGRPRDEYIQKLKQLNIGVGIHYDMIHTFSAYKEQSLFATTDLKNANEINGTIMSLPLYPNLCDHQQEYVIKTLNSI